MDPVHAVDAYQHVLIAHEVTRLIVQLGVIILAAKAAGALATRLRLPSLLGEVGAGLVLSPYALGSIGFPGFPDGLIPLIPGPFPIPVQLYGFAAVGAVIHILAIGLESEPELFVRMRPRGMIIAVSSSLAALVVGIGVPIMLFGFPLGDPRVLLFAAVSVSTSLGVQARILGSENRMGTAEAAVILRSSLLQDGIAIVVFAVALALVPTTGPLPAADAFTAALPVAALAVVVLASGFTFVVLTTPRVARTFRDLVSPTAFAVLAVGVTLVISGVFETFGVAAIIGAYIVGLALSRTDIADVLEEKIAPISAFFIPVLYAVMGMLIDFRILFTPDVLMYGIAFALLSGGAKVLGGGVPALLTGFNGLGALRIGTGTVPRGEIALIIGAVGLGSGAISPEVFKVLAVMVVVSVAISTPTIAVLFRSNRSGTRGDWGRIQTVVTGVDLPNEEMTELIAAGILRAAGEEGFFVHRMELAETLYRLRREELVITLRQRSTRIELVSDPRDAAIARTLLYEVIVHVRDRVGRISDIVVPEELRRGIAIAPERRSFALAEYLSPECTVVPMAATHKDEAIRELVDCLDSAGKLGSRDQVLADVLEREATVSTGMEKGIAIPHAKTDGVAEIVLAVGVSPDGIDFQSVDGLPAHLVFLIASPRESRVPHLQLLAAIATRFRDDARRSAAINARTATELVEALTTGE